MSATITTITTRPCFLCGETSTEEVTNAQPARFSGQQAEAVGS